MKLILFLLLVSRIGFAQDIPKRTNTIFVSSTLSDTALYKIAGQLLIKEGFTISKSDRDFLQIQTDPKKIRGVNSYPRLSVSVAANKVKVIGYFGSTLTLNDDPSKSIDRITNRGMKGSPFQVAFELMNAYADKLATAVEGKISYEVE